MDEFGLINTFFNVPARAQKARLNSGITLGIGDDCALYTPSPNSQLAFSVDTLVESVHFLKNTPADLIAKRALAVSISDLAAMGAQPKFFTLALTLPGLNSEWLETFSAGLFEAAETFNCFLAGGDTTRGPLAISVQVVGDVPVGAALTRSGAKVGDKIYVTGPLGDSAAGLALLSGELALKQGAETVVNKDLSDYLTNRYYYPQPKLQEGMRLREIASAAIDISDGLLADLEHVLSASNVGARVFVSKLPVTHGLRDYVSSQALHQWALTGGDDYQLCFTVSPEKISALDAKIASGELIAIEIGDVIARQTVTASDDSAIILEDAEAVDMPADEHHAKEHLLQATPSHAGVSVGDACTKTGLTRKGYLHFE